MESSDLYQNDRTRSLSADSNRNDYERIDKYSTYYDDSRRKPSRQNSYLEAVKTTAGGMHDGPIYLDTYIGELNHIL